MQREGRFLLSSLLCSPDPEWLSPGGGGVCASTSCPRPSSCWSHTKTAAQVTQVTQQL